MENRVKKSPQEPSKSVPSPLMGEGQDWGEMHQGLHPHPSPPRSREREHARRLFDTQRARTLRRNLTDAEQRLWSCLKRKQINGYKFRRQFPLGRYIVDFVCLEARLIIEVDGGQHSEQTAHDEMRDKWLASQRFRVLRFWNNDVLRRTDAVVEEIARAVRQPPPRPSPVKGEGELEKD